MGMETYMNTEHMFVKHEAGCGCWQTSVQTKIATVKRCGKPGTVPTAAGDHRGASRTFSW